MLVLLDRQVHYVGSFDDCTVFDSSRELGEPYEFLVGSTRVAPGFSDAVAGLSVGQSRRQTLTPADAYGARSRGRASRFCNRRAAVCWQSR
jgi:FKBP-type peptidyl-prolyl cis-trans isomerase